MGTAVKQPNFVPDRRKNHEFRLRQFGRGSSALLSSGGPGKADSGDGY